MDFSLCGKIADNISSVIVGKRQPVEFLLAALLAEGHVLLEDVPGVGKTLLAKTLAKAIGGEFKRVQFTPDLLPADITGFNIYDQKSGAFKFLPGPVMTNVLLADEINRTVPRTQSSLLESMEEGQVTVDGETFFLPRPFFTIATQNPIEHEGTYPLPEAQLDRFLMRLKLGYPSREEEAIILERFRQSDPLKTLEPVVTTEDIVALQQARRNIYVAEPVRNYILAICETTRTHPAVRFGASPRASMALMRTAQGLAALRGREYVLPDDIKCLAAPVLAHRLILKTESSLRGNSPEAIVADILSQTPVPVLET
ncbi:MAG TPA: MoxR family ATPase [Firmicutes bacterium]|nr:MoxR family ATPase [Bacillota bacterium]